MTVGKNETAARLMDAGKNITVFADETLGTPVQMSGVEDPRLPLILYKEVFSNIYSQKYDSFSLSSYKATDPRRDEMALFLNGVLCTQDSASEGCFVATCVYGSYDCPEVWTLRRFWDDTLGKHFWGRMFIRAYYAVSPAMVQCFGNTGWFRKLWRGVLDRMVRRLNGKGVEGTPYVDKGWR